MTGDRRRLDEAFAALPRELFLPANARLDTAVDAPLPIGFGQTNSQPSLVRQMLEWLDVHTGDKVLDVGSGSGWTSALLAYLTGPNGKVFAIEKVPELVRFGKENVRNIGVKNIRFYEAEEVIGWPKETPYDRILVSASAKELPRELAEQLALGGKMVVPVRNDILEVKKKPSGILDTLSHPGYAFVPLL